MKSETTTQPAEIDKAAALRKRLADIQAKREEAEAARTAEFETDDLERSIALEERKLREVAIVHDLERKHGREGAKIAVLETPEGIIVLKRPVITKYKAFAELEKITLDDQEQFVRDCLLYPDKTGWAAMVEAIPGIIVRAGKMCAALAGVRFTEELPKK